MNLWELPWTPTSTWNTSSDVTLSFREQLFKQKHGCSLLLVDMGGLMCLTEKSRHFLNFTSCLSTFEVSVYNLIQMFRELASLSFQTKRCLWLSALWKNRDNLVVFILNTLSFHLSQSRNRSKQHTRWSASCVCYSGGKSNINSFPS